MLRYVTISNMYIFTIKNASIINIDLLYLQEGNEETSNKNGEIELSKQADEQKYPEEGLFERERLKRIIKRYQCIKYYERT